MISSFIFQLISFPVYVNFPFPNKAAFFKVQKYRKYEKKIWCGTHTTFSTFLHYSGRIFYYQHYIHI